MTEEETKIKEEVLTPSQASEVVAGDVLVLPILCGRCSKPKGDTEESCKCGRPVIYGEEILKKADEYILSCEDSLRENSKWNVKIPTIEGLAVHLGISRETVYAWEKETDKKEFSDILAILRAKQAERLINNGLSGDYNSTIAKVLLTKHGYRDSQELSGPEGKDLKISFDPTFNTQ